MELKDIKKLIEWVSTHELTELEIEEDSFRVSMKRGGVVLTTPAAAQPAPLATSSSPAPAAPEANAAAPEQESFEQILSPIVGTFYGAASPEAASFVSVGQRVSEETVVCIVEAMKVMNEIKAETNGVIREILVENGAPVEYGQPLFSLEPR